MEGGGGEMNTTNRGLSKSRVFFSSLLYFSVHPLTHHRGISQDDVYKPPTTIVASPCGGGGGGGGSLPIVFASCIVSN